MPPSFDAAMEQARDVENAATDRFTALPPEILQTITSYLYATHFPEKASLPLAIHPRPFTDLISLHRTCKTLSLEVSSWAHHFLHHHRTITRYRDYKTPTAAAKQRPLTELLQWTSKRCVFCGAKSDRTAILMNGLHCCQKCDRQEWPDKITKTEAKKKYKLKDHQLLPERHHGHGLLARYPGLPRLRYGTYVSQGVVTTMFVTSEVEAMAKLADSDMSGHLLQRRKARDVGSGSIGRGKKVRGPEAAGTVSKEVGKTKQVEVIEIEDGSDYEYPGFSLDDILALTDR